MEQAPRARSQGHVRRLCRCEGLLPPWRRFNRPRQLLPQHARSHSRRAWIPFSPRDQRQPSYPAAGMHVLPNIKPWLLKASHPHYDEVARQGGFVRDADAPEQPHRGLFWAGGEGTAATLSGKRSRGPQSAVLHLRAPPTLQAALQRGATLTFQARPATRGGGITVAAPFWTTEQLRSGTTTMNTRLARGCAPLWLRESMARRRPLLSVGFDCSLYHPPPQPPNTGGRGRCHVWR